MLRTKAIFLKISIILVIFLIPSVLWALPIDWNGCFGLDATLIDTYRKVEQTVDRSSQGGGGSQEVPLGPGKHANASFQSYLFRLNPTMIVNDSATLKGEITSSYGRGGMLGDSTIRTMEGGFGNSLYLYNTTDQEDLIITKLFMELYSDTATYVLGRHTSHWGLGTVINSGENTWDRHTYVRDGITMKVKIGNFHISPFWTKISSGSSLTRATNVKEYGFSLLYDNSEQDIAFGILFSKRKNGANNTNVNADINNTGANSFGMTSVKLIDLYLKKNFGKFSFAVEAPIVNGDIGHLYNTTSDTKYKAKAIIAESSYRFSNSWKMGLHLGHVSGDEGNMSSYEAMYLNPNYQIANILFRYNMRAISGLTSAFIYDSYITNAKFAKLSAEYKLERWTWEMAYIYAIANEVAKGIGNQAHNHLTNKTYTATGGQSDNLGHEIDLNCTYFWNNEISIGGSLGYHLVGDYYTFSNDSGTALSAKNSFVAQLRTAINF